MKKAILGALVLSAFSAAQASAITIDFSSSAWNPSNNGSKTVGNTTVKAVSPGDPRSCPGTTTYGFGVNSHGADSDQIEENEYLKVTFSQAFRLTSFSVTRLFDDGTRRGRLLPSEQRRQLDQVRWHGRAATRR